jgi:UDP-N-acetylglucosamine 2-epimerase (non-hydrolysing)
MQMRILSVVGARPNFMKIAPVVSELRRVSEVSHRLVHTGQHYDDKLSGTFFDELGLPEPDLNLQVGSGSHTWQTAEVMKRLEPVLEEFRPDLVFVVGDVNSTLAAALTAVKLGIPVAHIEAGLRSFDLTMPEETNRKVTDTISELLFVTEQSGVDNLKAEGVSEDRIFLVGNVMIDTLLQHRAIAAKSRILEKLGVKNGEHIRPYGVLTLHRPSNVDQAETLERLLQAINELGQEIPVFFPIHPRTMTRVRDLNLDHYFGGSRNGSPTGLQELAPLGYLDFLCLMDNSRLVLTDSGGIQEETTALGVPCLTLRNNTERPATVEHGSNQIVGVDPVRIVSAGRHILRTWSRSSRRPPLWDGQAARRIVEGVLQKRLCDSAQRGHEQRSSVQLV